MENSQLTRRTSPHLGMGIAALGVAGTHVAVVLLFGWPLICTSMLLALLSLLFGGIAVLGGLALKENRRRPRLWKHIGVFSAIILTLYVLTVGPGNYFRLLDVRLRSILAMTGGADCLRSWAEGLLAKSRDHMENDYDDWRVPREYWSSQVHRLHPETVSIRMVFDNRQRGVCLSYGGWLLSYTIVVGPPGSKPRPNLNDPMSDHTWVTWAEGIHHWFQGR